ncbi:Phosphoribosyl transferase domain-containing protein [Chishuiella changwenlii]|uniref:Phosphoribosyl transferase domain-containing protein n=1 Tax=Chishuiella changwenlii TaxID=1434701 RepID=A0A1M6VYK0_9FLAO|nr:phosphoribosyltransferase family protein [Chishuiella changwenlii]GGE89553.1 hypothetical protein GCM10010984_04000 [Chishuiella changwenlii]SHK86560.1 Phosphoribosyl transferase domain-containing protein [Chishuiella changwenlii]
MKVIKFDKNVFDDFLESQLNNFLTKNENCLVIGIEEGGVPLAEIVKDYFLKKNMKVELIGVKCQRPSTKAKKNNQVIKNLLQKILKASPIFLLNFLRNIEHSVLMRKEVNSIREVTLPHKIDLTRYNKILIVDDAVDSGHSLKNVINTIKEKTSVNIYSMCVVVTNKNTCIWPDFYLHSEVLIRFPWSLDG